MEKLSLITPIFAKLTMYVSTLLCCVEWQYSIMVTHLPPFDISVFLQLRTQHAPMHCLIVSSQTLELVIYFAFSAVDHNVTNGANATFVNGESVLLPIILLTYLVKDVSIVIEANIALEFFMAQAPCQIRGSASTVFLLTCTIFGASYFLLSRNIRTQWTFYVVRCVVTLMLPMIFLFVSKWYKLRKRDDVIPYHMFAEDQFESNYRQETNWLKNHGYLDSSASSNESQ